MSPAAASRPWYREPLVWLVIAVPASAVVMGVVMIWLAIASDDGLVRDDYYRSGLEINRVLGRDRAAARLGLSARLTIGARGSSLVLDMQGPRIDQDSLDIAFFHATRAGFDRRARLTRTGAGRFEGAVAPLAAGAWNVELGGKDWRITGRLERLHPGAAAAILRAAAPG